LAFSAIIAFFAVADADIAASLIPHFFLILYSAYHSLFCTILSLLGAKDIQPIKSTPNKDKIRGKNNNTEDFRCFFGLDAGICHS
jgi:hypothetical protein